MILGGQCMKFIYYFNALKIYIRIDDFILYDNYLPIIIFIFMYILFINVYEQKI